MPDYTAVKPLNYKDRFYDTGKVVQMTEEDAKRYSGHVQLRTQKIVTEKPIKGGQ